MSCRLALGAQDIPGSAQNAKKDEDLEGLQHRKVHLLCVDGHDLTFQDHFGNPDLFDRIKCAPKPGKVPVGQGHRYGIFFVLLFGPLPLAVGS